MQELYHVSGTLNEGFVGQISYTICLEKEYNNLDIHFTFDKQHHTEATDELIKKSRNSVMRNMELSIIQKQKPAT